jgi:hypothetical protein
MKRFDAALLAVLLLTACPGYVFAHAVGVSCTLRGDKVEVEAYYDDDSPAIKAKVQVLNAKDEIVATGITDEKGRWNFDRPAPGLYEVRLDAGAGHRKDTTLTVPGLVNEPTPAAPTPTAVSSERDRFTQVPWLNVVIGLAVIGGGCAMFRIASRLRWATRVRSPDMNG